MLDERKFSYVRIRGKRVLVIGDIIKMPQISFYPDTPKRVVWLDPT